MRAKLAFFLFGIILPILISCTAQQGSGEEKIPASETKSRHSLILKMNAALVAQGFDENLVTAVGYEVESQSITLGLLPGRGVVEGTESNEHISLIAEAYMKRLSSFATPDKFEKAASVIYEMTALSLEETEPAEKEVLLSKVVDIAKKLGIREEAIREPRAANSGATTNTTSPSNAGGTNSGSAGTSTVNSNGSMASSSAGATPPPGGSTTKPPPPGRVRDGSVPRVKLTEKLNTSGDYEYPVCLWQGPAMGGIGSCPSYDPFLDVPTGTYKGERINPDLLFSDRWEAPAYNADQLLFGSSFSLELSNPPNGGTCKLFRGQPANNGFAYVDIGTSFSGKIEHGTDGVLDDGKSLSFQVQCNFSNGELRKYAIYFDVLGQLQQAAIIFQEDIPGPVMAFNGVVSGKKMLIKNGTRSQFLAPYDSTVIEVNSLTAGVNSLPAHWKQDRFVFSVNGFTVPAWFPVEGKFDPDAARRQQAIIPGQGGATTLLPTTGVVDFTVLVAPSRGSAPFNTYVFARGIYSKTPRYKVLAKMPSTHHCGYKGGGQQGYEATFRSCFFNDITADVLVQLTYEGFEFADLSGRFLPYGIGAAYTAADLFLYQDKTIANQAMAGLLILSAGASGLTSVCGGATSGTINSMVGTYARATYVASEVAQVGLSVTQLAYGSGGVGDYLQIGLLAYQGGRFAVAKSFQFDFKVPPFSTARGGSAAVAKGIAGGKTEVPAALKPAIENAVGVAQVSTTGDGITHVNNSALAATVKNMPGGATPVKQFVGGEDRLGVSKNEINFAKNDTVPRCTVDSCTGEKYRPFDYLEWGNESLESHALSALVPGPDNKLMFDVSSFPDAPVTIETMSAVAILERCSGKVLVSGGAEQGAFTHRSLPPLTPSQTGHVPVGFTEIVKNGRTQMYYAIMPDGAPFTAADLGVDKVVTPSQWDQFSRDVLGPLFASP